MIEHGKKNALLIVVPSLDTGVCSLESRKFNTRIAKFPPDMAVYVVSRDLPFAQARWAKEEGESNRACSRTFVTTVSARRTACS